MIKKISILILVTTMLVSWIVPVLAAPSFVGSDTGIVNITSPVGDDTYIGGTRISIDRDIQGDLFIGGGDVVVNGNISGDLLIGATGVVQVIGNVGDDIRIISGQVVINGIVGDDLLIGTGSLVINEGAVIKGDLLGGAKDFELHGEVLGSVKANFNKGEITGLIRGDANLEYSEELIFSENARISGKLAYWAKAENLEFEKIAGSVEYYKSSLGWTGSNLGVMNKADSIVTFGSLALKYLGILLLGGLLVLFLPKYMPRVTTAIKKNYLSLLWQGFIFFVLVPFVALMSLVTLVGAPLSLVLMLSYALMIIFSGVVGAMLIGSYFIKPGKTKISQFSVLAVGGVVYVVLVLIPFVGWVIKLLFILLGLGGIWKDSYSMIKAGKY